MTGRAFCWPGIWLGRGRGLSAASPPGRNADERDTGEAADGGGVGLFRRLPASERKAVKRAWVEERRSGVRGTWSDGEDMRWSGCVQRRRRCGRTATGLGQSLLRTHRVGHGGCAAVGLEYGRPFVWGGRAMARQEMSVGDGGVGEGALPALSTSSLDSLVYSSCLIPPCQTPTPSSPSSFASALPPTWLTLLRSLSCSRQAWIRGRTSKVSSF